MGQVNTASRAQNSYLKQTHVRMNQVFKELETEINHGKSKLHQLRQKQNIGKTDVDTFKQTLEELENRYNHRLKTRSRCLRLLKRLRSQTQKMSLHNSIRELEAECERWGPLLKEWKRLSWYGEDDNQCLIIELTVTKGVLRKLHKADIYTTTTPATSQAATALKTQTGKNESNQQSGLEKVDDEANAYKKNQMEGQGENALKANRNGTADEKDSNGCKSDGTGTQQNASIQEDSSHYLEATATIKNNLHKNGDINIKGQGTASLTQEHSQAHTERLKVQLLEAEKQNRESEQKIIKLTTERDQTSAEKAKALQKATETSRHSAKIEEENTKLIKNVESLTKDLDKVSDNRDQLNQQVELLKKEWHNTRKQNAELQSENQRLSEYNKDLLIWLSKAAGEKLSENNPNIADLSDKNRPTKLGEMYSELYDNEWTDAYDALLVTGHVDTDIIITLKTTLEHSYIFCEEELRLMRKKIHDAVNLLCDNNVEIGPGHQPRSSSTMSNRSKTNTPAKRGQEMDTFQDIRKMRQMWKPKKAAAKPKKTDSTLSEKTQIQHVDVNSKIKTLEKEVAESVVPIVQKEYLDMFWSEDCVPAMKPYIKKCLYICWMMIVQSPPMCFTTDPQPGEILDTNVYKQYMSVGKYVDYGVWPALMLHKGGPLVCKGVLHTK